jgi:hypothetical protein
LLLTVLRGRRTREIVSVEMMKCGKVYGSILVLSTHLVILAINDSKSLTVHRVQQHLNIWNS